jgi:hypothetical protein
MTIKITLSKTLFLILFVLITNCLVQASSSTENGITLPNNLKLVGKASLSVLFWDVYDSELKTLTGSYEKETAPLLLSLTYKRSISSKDLIDETESQWERFKLPKEQEKRWLEQLSETWPSVKENDVIAVYLDKNKYCHFFFNDNLIGSFKDTEFSRYFLAIWLDENGEYPKLTRKLTGKK